MAEAKAIGKGLAHCVEQQLHPLIIETDSLIMKRIIDEEWDPPWCIGIELKKIKGLKDQYNVIF